MRVVRRLAALALLVAGCGDAGRGDALRPLEETNVLLVVIDTVGAEHVEALAGTGHTPALDALAREGVSFRRAYTPAPWTQPALASLFTSRMPSRHGLVRLFDALSAEQTTLPELLRERGFETAGIVSHELLDEKYGFAQGFDHYDASPSGGHRDVTSFDVTDRALAWLEARDPGSRFFLFVHYFDPHYVYNHHPEHDLSSGYDGPLGPGMPIWSLRAMRASLSAEDIRFLVGLYREEIAFVDAQLGRLLERLEELRVADRTLVVVTSDHGEEFMGHGWIGHTRTLYEELLRVPLLIRLPGIAGGRVVDAPVSLLDIVPTLLSLSGVPSEAGDGSGRSLLPHLRGEGVTGEERELFAEVSFVLRPGDPDRMVEKVAIKTALIGPELKLIHDTLSDRFELYDPSADPGEQDDLVGQRPEQAELQRRLLEWERDRPLPPGDAPGIRVTDEERERLRTLGYLR